MNSWVARLLGRVARFFDRLGVFDLIRRLPERRRVDLVADLVPMTLSKPAFREWEARGIHVTPVHFYQPIPNTATLSEELWNQRSELAGVDLRLDDQERLLERLSAYRPEYDALPDAPVSDPRQFVFGNEAFGPVDAEVLYALVRLLRPLKVVEVGAGWSTRLIAQALRANKKDDPSYESQFVTIDPLPDPALAPLAQVRASRVQDVDPQIFAGLGRNDILFIDSSHVVQIGSDVVYEILDVLPSLQSGVAIHFHDIFLPAEYPRNWVLDEHRFWNEQYMLQAFLAYNSAFEILLANSLLHSARPDLLQKAFRRYGPHVLPGSLWMRRR